MKKIVKKDVLNDISQIFRQLESKNIHELNGYLVPDLLSLDALRVILYKFSLSILFYKERILLNDLPEDLHQFRVYIRKSRALLKEFKFLFPTKEYQYIFESLSMFTVHTNKKRDLDVIGDLLSDMAEDCSTLQEYISQQQRIEEEKIEIMLRSQTFRNFFITYQDILKTQKLLRAHNNTDTIAHVSAEVIAKLQKKIYKKINALEDSCHDKDLHKIRIAFKKLRYLLEEFQNILGESKIHKMIKNVKKVQTLLGSYNDNVNQSALVDEVLRENKDQITQEKAIVQFLRDSSDKSTQLRMKAIKKLHKFTKDHKPL